MKASLYGPLSPRQKQSHGKDRKKMNLTFLLFSKVEKQQQKTILLSLYLALG